MMRHRIPIELRRIIDEHWPWLSLREKEWLQQQQHDFRNNNVEFDLPGNAFSEKFLFCPETGVVVRWLQPNIGSIQMHFLTTEGDFQNREFGFTKMLEQYPEENQPEIYKAHFSGDCEIRTEPFCESDLSKTLIAKMLHSYTHEEAERAIDFFSKRVWTQGIRGRFTLDYSPNGKPILHNK